MNHKRKKKQPTTKHQQAREHEQTPTALATTTTSIIEKKETSPTDVDTAQHHWDSEERFFYRWYLRTQAVLVFITIGGIAVAICSLRSLNRSVSAAKEQANAAATQAKVVQQEFEASERPYMTPFSNLSGQPMVQLIDNGVEHAVQIYFRNTGKSQADGVYAEVWTWLPDVEVAVNPPSPPPWQVAHESVPPTYPFAVTDSVTVPEWTWMRAGNFAQIIGRVQYSDVKRSYCDSFCISYWQNHVGLCVVTQDLCDMSGPRKFLMHRSDQPFSPRPRINPTPRVQ